jgi:hypothetical protein
MRRHRRAEHERERTAAAGRLESNRRVRHIEAEQKLDWQSLRHLLSIPKLSRGDISIKQTLKMKTGR